MSKALQKKIDAIEKGKVDNRLLVSAEPVKEDKEEKKPEPIVHMSVSKELKEEIKELKEEIKEQKEDKKCEDHILKFGCPICNVVYCEKCGERWSNQITVHPPVHAPAPTSTMNPNGPPQPIIDRSGISQPMKAQY